MEAIDLRGTGRFRHGWIPVSAEALAEKMHWQGGTGIARAAAALHGKGHLTGPESEIVRAARPGHRLDKPGGRVPKGQQGKNLPVPFGSVHGRRDPARYIQDAAAAIARRENEKELKAGAAKVRAAQEARKAVLAAHPEDHEAGVKKGIAEGHKALVDKLFADAVERYKASEHMGSGGKRIPAGTAPKAEARKNLRKRAEFEAQVQEARKDPEAVARAQREMDRRAFAAQERERAVAAKFAHLPPQDRAAAVERYMHPQTEDPAEEERRRAQDQRMLAAEAAKKEKAEAKARGEATPKHGTHIPKDVQEVLDAEPTEDPEEAKLEKAGGLVRPENYQARHAVHADATKRAAAHDTRADKHLAKAGQLRAAGKTRAAEFHEKAAAHRAGQARGVRGYAKALGAAFRQGAHAKNAKEARQIGRNAFGGAARKEARKQQRTMARQANRAGRVARAAPRIAARHAQAEKAAQSVAQLIRAAEGRAKGLPGQLQAQHATAARQKRMARQPSWVKLAGSGGPMLDLATQVASTTDGPTTTKAGMSVLVRHVRSSKTHGMRIPRGTSAVGLGKLHRAMHRKKGVNHRHSEGTKRPKTGNPTSGHMRLSGNGARRIDLMMEALAEPGAEIPTTTRNAMVAHLRKAHGVGLDRAVVNGADPDTVFRVHRHCHGMNAYKGPAHEHPNGMALAKAVVSTIDLVGPGGYIHGWIRPGGVGAAKRREATQQRAVRAAKRRQKRLAKKTAHHSLSTPESLTTRMSVMDRELRPLGLARSARALDLAGPKGYVHGWIKVGAGSSDIRNHLAAEHGSVHVAGSNAKALRKAHLGVHRLPNQSHGHRGMVRSGSLKSGHTPHQGEESMGLHHTKSSGGYKQPGPDHLALPSGGKQAKVSPEREARLQAASRAANSPNPRAKGGPARRVQPSPSPPKSASDRRRDAAAKQLVDELFGRGTPEERNPLPPASLPRDPRVRPSTRGRASPELKPRSEGTKTPAGDKGAQVVQAIDRLEARKKKTASAKASAQVASDPWAAARKKFAKLRSNPEAAAGLEHLRPGSIKMARPDGSRIDLAVLRAAARKKIADTDFGLPEQRKYPMKDRRHAGNAKSRAAAALRKGHINAGQYRRIIRKANRKLGKAA